MGTIKKFEELLVFKKSRELTKQIYFELKDCKDYGFKDQIQRASVSVLSNIAEGFERGTKNELINYLQIAKGSAGEVRAQLYVALDVGYIEEETFERLRKNAEEISRMLYGFTKGVKKLEFRGQQYQVEKTDRELAIEEIDAMAKSAAENAIRKSRQE